MIKKYKIVIVLFIVIIIGIVLGIYYKNDENVSNSSSNANEVTYTENNIDLSNIEKIQIDLSSIKDSYIINKTGVYHFNGTLNGYIFVNTNDNVQIILDNVTIQNNSGPCIYVENVNNLYIELIGENNLEDGDTYNGFSDINGVIFSKDDLIIYGDGVLNIKANYQDGIVSKDDLVIESGIFNISSKDDGIRGTDSVVIQNGTFTINSQGDGIKSTNENDKAKGNILIQNGTFNIDSSGDAIDAVNNCQIDNGTFTITTGGGYKTVSSYRGIDGNITESDVSSKGIKAGGDILIKNGTYSINSYDDSIHSDNIVEIQNGTFEISSSDDGIHGDSSVLISGGIINILNSYEGIEANNITINNGEIKAFSRDDGINISGGNDNSGFGSNGRTTNISNNNKLIINGGNLYINSQGDGLDANGSIYITGGNIYVDGPTDNGNGPLDYDGEFEITGGLLVAAGSSGMMQNVTKSNQATMLIYFNSTQSAGTNVSIGNITYTPSKSFGCILISTNLLELEKTYDIKLNNNLYQKITISNYINTVDNNMVNEIGRGGRHF